MPDAAGARLTAALTELCHAVAADGGGVLFLDEGDGTLHLAASVGGERGRSRSVRQLLRGQAADDDRRTLVMRLGSDAGGMIVLSRRAGAEFTHRDRALVRLYARRFTDEGVPTPAQIGRTKWMRQLEAIQRIAARLTRLASVQEVAATVCSETTAVVDHDEAHVLIMDDRGSLQRAAASGASDRAVTPLPNDGACAEAVARAVNGGVPVLVADAPGLGPERPGPHSLLIVPLHYESRVTGLICLVARGTGRFDDDDVRLLQVLSDQAAVAIENARLLSGRDQLVHELSGLLEVSEAASAATDERALAGLLAARLRAALRVDAAVVARWDEGSTAVRVLARDGVRDAHDSIDIASSPARRQLLRDGRPLVIHAHDDSLIEAAQLRRVGAHSLVLLPLNAGGRTIGMVELTASGGPRQPTPAEMQACEALAGIAATGLEKVRILEQLRSAADVDLVSGVHNHRYLQERLRQEVARSARSHSPLAVLMLDLDRFKPINDRHGHADGDRVLHSIASTVKAHVRTSDVVARYGGDEFVVLMPDTGEVSAEQVARRVVSGVLQQRHPLSDGSHVSVGVSAGLATYPRDGRTSTQLLQAADAAMYEAKRDGGRQIERPPSAGLLEVGEPIPARASA